MRKFLMVLAALCMVSCAAGQWEKNLAWSYRVLHWNKLAAETANMGVIAWQRSETKRCLTTHGPKTVGYAKCIDKSLVVMRKWTGCKTVKPIRACKGGIYPSLVAGHKTTLAGLELAYAAGKSGKADPKTLIKPVLCLCAWAIGVLKEAGVPFGPLDESINKVLGFSDLICE